MEKRTANREAIKIGIAKGTSFKDVIRRSAGFTGYELRIQKIVKGPLEEIFYLEQYLHELWQEKKLKPTHKFGGWTECFEIDPAIIRSVPDHV